MLIVLLVLLVAAILVAALVAAEFKKKYIHIWLRSYLKQVFSRKAAVQGPTHIMFAFCDHYEPAWGRPTYEKEVERVDRWLKEYPETANRHRDADGCYPKHSFFYPEEEYRPEHLAKLVDLCRAGYGEIEVHLHHDHDTAEGLKEKIGRFLKTLDDAHYRVPRDPKTGQFRFAFIHGNWALDNSRLDGRWCGINNELKVLADAGCYADFTLPSAPSETQTSKINSIYYATGRDGMAKSHDTGVDVEYGKKGKGDLMIIQGPLMLNWRSRKYGLLPKIENSDIRKSFPPNGERIDLWVKAGVHVANKPEWKFIKIHTHGTQDGDIATVLGEEADQMYSYLEKHYNDGSNYVLHYVSAREMYNIIRAAEDGLGGNPNEYRDYDIPAPSYQ